MQELYLNSLDKGIPAITKRQAGVHMEACIWCLLECKHENGVVLTVQEGNIKNQYKICWSQDEIDVSAILRAYNKDDGPEHGAEAIALLLIRERTDYTAIQRSVTSTGIDYWLGYQSEINNNTIFNQKNARLEVSAILCETKTNRVKTRKQQKVRQSRQSDHTSFPAYVVIVEFSQPLAEVEIRHV